MPLFMIVCDLNIENMKMRIVYGLIILLIVALAISTLKNFFKTEHAPQLYTDSNFEKVDGPINPVKDNLGSANQNQIIQVIGKGSYVLFSGTTSFSFTAILKKDGNANGHMVYKDSYLNFLGTIDCLSIKDNVLVISGVITKVGGDALISVRERFQFAFEDNGNGSGNHVDKMSVASYGSVTCKDPNTATPYPIKGDIQIKKHLNK